MGVGSAMMDRALSGARATGARLVHMAASHKSHPFLLDLVRVPQRPYGIGSGPNLHRVDMELVP